MPDHPWQRHRRETWRRVSERQAERWAYRDEHTRLLVDAIAASDVDLECSHGHLPADPNKSCSCWDTDMNEVAALRGELEMGLRRLEEAQEAHTEQLVAAIDRLADRVAEGLAASGRDLFALQQVVKAVDGGG